MAWIESNQTLARHPKAIKAARKLGISVPTVVGHLHFLWWWCLEYANDGDLSRFDASDIAVAAGWEGDAEEFVTALVDCGPRDSVGFIIEDSSWAEGIVRLNSSIKRGVHEKWRGELAFSTSHFSQWSE